MKRFAVFMMVGSLSVSAVGSPLQLSDLQTKLKSVKGATWTAGETNVSRLSPDIIHHMLGAKLPEGFGDYFKPAGKTPKLDLPTSFDWRNVNGVSYASPILNQEDCGSCVAFAAIGTLETQLNISRKTTDSPWEFSPQYIFSCGGGSCNEGWDPGSAADFLKSTGVPDGSCMPYTAGLTGNDVACSAACPDAASRSVKIADYTTPTSFMLDVNAVKQALQKGPLMASMNVYEDFLFYTGGVYKHVSGDMEGGHEVSIVGYDDSVQAFIVRNNWGDAWGENGFFRIAYDDTSGVGSQTWGFDVGTADGYVTIDGIRDGAVLTGQPTLNVNSTYTGTESVEWSLAKNGVAVGYGNQFKSTSFVVDTTKYADGAYTLTAVAHYGSTSAQSEARTVNVLNGAFTGSIQMTGITAGQTLTGDQTFNLTTQASPFPFTAMTFHAKSVATGADSVRQANASLPQMVMFWRSETVPNGDYDLTVVGTAGPGVTVSSAPIRVTVKN